MPLDAKPAPIPMPSIDLAATAPAPTAIRELLALSASAHQRYREQVPQRHTLGGATLAVTGDATLARAALDDAYRLRLAAHEADPLHTDPAWADEPVSHDELMAFYAVQRAR